MNEDVSPTAKALFEKLRAFCNNRDFVLGVMCHLVACRLVSFP